LKNIDQDLIEKYIGKYKNCYLSYACNYDIRSGAASGGVISALLIHLLESGNIDGALVCKTVCDNGIGYEFIIAKTRDEVLSAQTSKYFNVKIYKVLELIKQFNGRLAVVALPCDTKIISNLKKKDDEFDKKIKYIFTLFCNHNSEDVLIKSVFKKIGVSENNITDFKFRIGHWRGQMQIELEGGEVIKVPSSKFLIYQNLFFFSLIKCLYCYDHTGYYSDISFGDTWLYKLKKDTIKYSSIIAKTKNGHDLLLEAAEGDCIKLKKIDIEQICEGQKRSLPFHYNVSARAKVGKLLGFKIKDYVNHDIKWNNYIAAFIVLFNHKLSHNKFWSKYIFRIPKPVLQLYLYFLKFLQGF
jgi:coenzyme F420-reducing hydrogenase beta subunit